MFSQTAEYALRAAVALAEGGGSTLSAAALAQQTQVPGNYLFKVMGQLVRGGVAEAVRGKRGGYRLCRPAQEVSVLDVIGAVDPLPRIHHCPLNRPDHIRALCPLHQQLDDTYAQIESAWRARSLAELMERPPAAPPADPCGALPCHAAAGQEA